LTANGTKEQLGGFKKGHFLCQWRPETVTCFGYFLYNSEADKTVHQEWHVARVLYVFLLTPTAQSLWLPFFILPFQ